MEAGTGFVTAPGARLFVRDVGSGTPIVVLHGGPDFDYDYLLPELDVLAERSRVIHYDQRGRGRSADGVRPDDVTLDSEMDDLDRVRGHFGLESIALLGHSWGCVLAMEYARRHRERLSHLILMNTAPATYDDARVLRAHLQSRRPAQELEAMQVLAASAEFRAGSIDVEAAYYRLHFRPGVPRADVLDRLIPRLRANFTPKRVLTARAIEERLYEQTWSIPGYDLLANLHELEVPTLVLHGEHDLIPIEVALHVAAAIHGARLVVVPGSGHFTYLEAPEVVAGQVATLLDE